MPYFELGIRRLNVSDENFSQMTACGRLQSNQAEQIT